jgi:hypothetical protein
VIKGQSLREAWRSLRHREMVEIETLRHATREMLQHRLAESGVEKAVHVVHFIGHGVADDRESAIMLEKPDGTSDPITAEEFAELIWRPSVGMVMLNACETAAPLQLFNGAAQQALRRGVPVVIVRGREARRSRVHWPMPGDWCALAPRENSAAGVFRCCMPDLTWACG